MGSIDGVASRCGHQSILEGVHANDQAPGAAGCLSGCVASREHGYSRKGESGCLWLVICHIPLMSGNKFAMRGCERGPCSAFPSPSVDAMVIEVLNPSFVSDTLESDSAPSTNRYAMRA